MNDLVLGRGELMLTLAAVAVSCFASMVITILMSISALERQEHKYGRLLARYVATRETLPEMPDWVSGANATHPPTRIREE